MTSGDGTTNPGNFASQLLAGLGLPTSQAWQDVINVWVHAEGGFNPATSGGAAANNPLNTNCSGWGLQIGCVTLSNGAKVGVYPNLDAAVQSYATGLEKNAYGYPAIFGASSPIALANAISASGWSTSHYSGYKATISDYMQTGRSVPLTGLGALLYQQTKGYTVATTGSSTNVSQYMPGINNPAGGVTVATAQSAVSAWLAGKLGLLSGSLTQIAVNLVVGAVAIFLIVIGLWQLVKGATDTSGAKSMKEIAGAVAGLAARQSATVAPTVSTPSVPTVDVGDTFSDKAGSNNTPKPTTSIDNYLSGTEGSNVSPSGQRYSPDTVRVKKPVLAHERTPF